jgi:PAS domain-containing protein
MPDDVEATGAEVSDAMSENEYDDNEHTIKPEGMTEQNTSPDPGTENSAEIKKKYDPKDPHRPRRKKARRACFACQRAHLTCGDERPCQRCIKRGLADACQDGVRKKAKYLHDAPPEALRPVLGPTYNPNTIPKPTNGRHPSNTSSEHSAYYQQPNSSATYPIYPSSTPGQATALPEGIPFGNQQSPVSSSFQPPSNPRSTSMSSISMPQVSNEMPPYSTALFDPSNPAIFNFDLEGLNFGSHYGALEFGILGHMSSGAAETPPRDSAVSQASGADVNYGTAPMFSNGNTQFNQLYDNGLVDNYMSTDQNRYAQGNLQHGLPHAYAVAAGPTPSSLASPGTDNTASPQPTGYGFDNSPKAGTYTPGGSQSIPQPQRPKPKSSQANNNKLGPQSILGKRHRDPSSIYETVKEPYPYLTGFHNLIAFVQKRFSANKTLRIAKSLASIRPSFIATTRTLNRQDLIFMEKCLQRTLFEYEDFMGHCSAPTIVCRRTGEVAAVNKEFIALTGWTKDILLGKVSNHNVNTGGQSGNLGNPGKPGLTTPRLMNAQPERLAIETKQQPVFIAEFMDDDSVIQFYEDFAQLAFGDSRGHVTRKCRLLKYQTKESVDAGDDSPQQRKDPRSGSSSILSNRVTRIDGEHGISKLEKDGKIDCTFCWTIKRDVFDIPMLIVMNFLPCYYRNHDQLAI